MENDLSGKVLMGIDTLLSLEKAFKATGKGNCPTNEQLEKMSALQLISEMSLNDIRFCERSKTNAVVKPISYIELDKKTHPPVSSQYWKAEFEDAKALIKCYVNFIKDRNDNIYLDHWFGAEDDEILRHFHEDGIAEFNELLEPEQDK